MSKLDCVRKALRSGDLVGRKILWGGGCSGARSDVVVVDVFSGGP